MNIKPLILARFEPKQVALTNRNDWHKLNRNIQELKLTKEIELIRFDLTKEIEIVRSDLTKEIEKVRAEIYKSKSEIIKWVIGLLFAQTGLLIAVFKILQ